MRVAVLATVLACCTVGLSVADPAIAAASRKPINIPPQELALALQALAKERDFQIVCRADLVKDLHSTAVSGELTPYEALSRLLSGTGLTYQALDDQTITIVPIATAPVPQAATPDTPRAKEAQKTSSFWDRFRVAQVDHERAANAADSAVARESADTGRVRLEEVVVSAQKRQERLQDVPVPVALIDGDALATNSQHRLQDYYTKVPGLSIVPGASSSTFGIISIRGITTGGSTNPTVGITVDDVPYGSSTALGGGTAIPDVDPSDLERVEVLRGPQGTLYGASSLGGLIKFVTTDPSTSGFAGRIEAGVNGVRHGNDPGLNLRGTVNVPLSDELAVRASAFTRRDAGYVDNPVTGIEGINEQRVRGGRLAALWTPSSDVSLKLSALYQDFEADGVNSVDPALGEFEQNYIRGAGWNRGTIQAYSAVLTAKLGSAELTSLSGYNVREFENADDFTGAFGGAAQQLYGVGGAAITTDQKNEKFSQELRLSMPLGARTELLVGGFYTDEDAPAVQEILAIDTATGATVATGYRGTYPTAYREYAAFANLTFAVSDRFDIQFGGRRSWIRQTTLPSVTVAPIFGATDPSVTEETRASAQPFTYLLTPRFRISPDLMVYARVASGYRAGGSNVQSCVIYLTFPCAFQPDETQNYEIGAKGLFFEHRLSVDGSIYYIDWKDIQLQANDPVSRVFYNTNASRAKSQGVELAFELRPADRLVLSSWVAWDTAELTEPFPANSPALGASGDRLPYGSRFSGSFSIEQSFPVGRAAAFLGASLSYVGDRVGVFKATGVQRQVLPGYARTDLHTGLRYDLWSLNVFANNIFDKRGVLQGPLDTFPAAYLYIQPRIVGLSVARTF